MITFKIFIALLYIIYLFIMAVSGFLVVRRYGNLFNQDLKPVKAFIGLMMVVDHVFLLWIVVNYIRLLIGR